jgi:predicted ATP-grasp superfamily ATP-dependent carboligase
MPTRILITGSSLFFSARLIHDLGRRGAIVTAADSLPLSAGKASWFVSHRVRLPSVNTDPGRFLEAVLAELRARPYDLLLPTFEEALLLAEYQSEIRPYARLFLPPFPTMYELHHKPSLHQLCLSLGLQTPPTLVVDDASQLEEVPDRFGFPVVLKLPAGNNAVGRSFCDSKEELHRKFTRLASEQQQHGGELPFIQKRIQGPLICTLCFCLQGQKLGEVIYRTSRMFPQAGGTAAHKESITNSTISQITDRLIAATGWSGFLGFDFVLEDGTGIPYLIDANPRTSPAIHLGFCSGLDWSQLILDLAQDKLPRIQTARAGVNVHTLLIDMSWLLEGLLSQRGGIMRFPRRCWDMLFPGWPIDSRDDLLSIGEFASAAVVGTHAICMGTKALLTGQPAGHHLLEHASYDPVTAAEYRSQRSIAASDRVEV